MSDTWRHRLLLAATLAALMAGSAAGFTAVTDRPHLSTLVRIALYLLAMASLGSAWPALYVADRRARALSAASDTGTLPPLDEATVLHRAVAEFELRAAGHRDTREPGQPPRPRPSGR